MSIKKTKLLVAELRVIAGSLDDHCKSILNEAATRLEDTDKIAEFFRKKSVKNCKRGGD